MSPKRKLDRKLVFIPPWMKQVQNTYNLPNSELISLAPLLDIITMEDVSFYYACNEIFKTSTAFKAFTDTFDMVDLFENTRSKIGETKQIIIEGNDNESILNARDLDIERILQNVSASALITCESIKSMSGYTNNMDNAIAAMQQTLSRIEPLKQNLSEHVRDNYVFEMLPIDGMHVGISFTRGGEADNHHECYKKCIEFLCNVYPFETVAQTSIFSSWTGVIHC